MDSARTTKKELWGCLSFILFSGVFGCDEM